eukprot:TRINITY_DN2350_c0_g1_i2.p2 TRINITY_DN2350_c0_g1~~TRINITY_DN2350_c0_g1_i2.p2  ORF type:complete len:316 (+),score=88.72 TRINITY_DN2350_c0_g1_i2:67-948(+)
MSTKLFVGGLPKTADENTVTQFFSYAGAVQQVELKRDPETGNSRGFCFVTFDSPQAVQMCIDSAASNTIDGKWVEVKAADGKGGGKGGKGKGGGGGKGWGGQDSWGGKGGGGGWGGDSWGGGGDSWGGDSWGGGGGWGKGKGGKGGMMALGGGGGYGKSGGKGKKGGVGPPAGPQESSKIFIGGLPKAAGEDEVRQFFSQFGAVTEVILKYDEQYISRGFGFVSFTDSSGAAAAVAASQDKAGGGCQIQGKWIDCKLAVQQQKGEGGGKGKGGKGKGGGKGGGYGGESWGSPY